MRTSIAMLTVAASISIFSSAAFGDDHSLRERLTASENVDEVYAIDDNHTYVKPVIIFFGFRTCEPSEAIEKEIIAACPGEIEVESSERDPVTKETKQTWEPYDRMKGSDLLHRITWDKNGARNDYYGVRCSGEFEITTPFINRGDRGKTCLQAFIIRHERPQPFLFRNSKFKIDDIKVPQEGEFKIGGLSFGGFFKSLVGRDETYGALAFEYMKGLCEQKHAKMKYVANKCKFISDSSGPVHRWDSEQGTADQGRCEAEYKELSAEDAFKYSVSGQSQVKKVLFHVCESPDGFILREEANVTYSGGNRYVEDKAYFASHRGLEGINYIPLNSFSESPSSEPVGPHNEQERVALEVAKKRTNILKTVGVTEYIGIYNGKSPEGCDLVSVEKNWNTNAKQDKKDTYNYVMCNGQISTFVEAALPRGIAAFEEKLAKVAQKLGNAEGEYQGYLVKSHNRNDKDGCSIDSEVIKDDKLLSQRVIRICD